MTKKKPPGEPRKSIWDGRDHILRKHHADGLSALESSKLLGVTKNAVTGRRHRLGLCENISQIQQRIMRSGPTPKPPAIIKASKAPAFIPLPVRLPTPPRLPAVEAPVVTSRPWETRLKHECCWPMGRDAEGVMLYCCAPILYENTQRWCQKHADKGYAANSPWHRKAG